MGKITKLDFKTNFFLYMTKAKKVEHMPVTLVKNKKRMYVSTIRPNEVYVFENYDEYRRFFKMFFENVEDSLIDLAIYTRGKKGQVVAIKDLCKQIIIKNQMIDAYAKMDNDKLEEIHKRGKFANVDMVDYCRALDICAPAGQGIIERSHCDFFNCDCYLCLAEHFSRSEEYDVPNINELDEEEKAKVKTLIDPIKKRID